MYRTLHLVIWSDGSVVKMVNLYEVVILCLFVCLYWLKVCIYLCVCEALCTGLYMWMSGLMGRLEKRLIW